MGEKMVKQEIYLKEPTIFTVVQKRTCIKFQKNQPKIVEHTSNTDFYTYKMVKNQQYKQ